MRGNPCRWWCVALVVVLAGSHVHATPAPDEVLHLRVRRGEAAARPLGDLLRGAPAVVSFWAEWCPPCRAEVPVLRRAAARWRDAGLRVVGVAIGMDDAAAVVDAAARWEIDYEAVWLPPTDPAVLERLLPHGLPTTVLVGPGGAVRYDRLLHDADLERLVPPLLERPVD